MDKDEYELSSIDGHILMCRNRSIRWLTLWERLQYLFKFKTATELDSTSIGEF